MNKETVFVIGDSISLNYGPYLEDMIRNKYNYGRKSNLEDAMEDLDKPIGANAGDSSMVLEYLKEEHDKGVRYEILLLNCGLHDVRVDRDTKKIQIDEETYEKNLNEVIGLANKMAKKVFWITTTPVNDEIHNKRKFGFLRYNKDVLKYNKIADKIMMDNGVSSIDLYKFTSTLGKDIYRDHVHFKEDIVKMQSSFIAGYLFGLYI